MVLTKRFLILLLIGNFVLSCEDVERTSHSLLIFNETGGTLDISYSLSDASDQEPVFLSVDPNGSVLDKIEVSGDQGRLSEEELDDRIESLFILRDVNDSIALDLNEKIWDFNTGEDSGFRSHNYVLRITESDRM